MQAEPRELLMWQVWPWGEGLSSLFPGGECQPSESLKGIPVPSAAAGKEVEQ